MKKGFFSLIGLVMLFALFLVYLAAIPALQGVINKAMPLASPLVKIVLSLIIPFIFFGLIYGFWLSINPPEY